MVFCGDEVVKSTHGCVPRICAAFDPVHGHADNGPADNSQVEGGVAVAHAAAVFSSDDVQPLVKAVFNAPILSIGDKHLFGVHLGRRARSQEELDFSLFGRFARKLDAAGQLGALFGEGKLDALGTELKDGQRAILGALAVDLGALCGGSGILRGKKSA